MSFEPPPYVRITRHFREVSEDPKDGWTRQMLRNMGRGSTSPTTWNDLLRRASNGMAHAIVLVAPSGTGKSTEAEHQVERLRAEGVAAFGCDAGTVATDGLRASLRGSAAEFDTWAAGDAHAVLFLDAVDEVYLRQRSWRDVMRCIGKEIDFGTRDVQIVVTARSGSWSSAHRRELESLLQARAREPKVKVVTFEPIDVDAIAALAKAGGVNDFDSFMQRFIEDELYNLVDLRPRDVQLFVNYWNRHGTFGTWTEILVEFCETSLVESNPSHQQHQRLSQQLGTEALQRIAAASILTKRPHITLPMSAALPGAMDGHKLFGDWEGRLLRELFDNGLFVHKGDAAVQLPQGALTHFLTSRWFADRYRRGWRVDRLREALFVQVFDERRWRIPESKAAVVGWVASEVPELRRVLIEERPETLLYQGDPRRLATSDIASALRKIVETASVKGTPWPTKATVRQLCRPDLEETIVELLRQYRDSPRAQQHLLRYVELGGYTRCLPHASELALDRTADAHSRVAAISAIAKLGQAAHKVPLLAIVGDADLDVRTELLEALVPEYLRGEDLVQFLLGPKEYRFRYFARQLIDRVELNDIDATLERLLPLVQSSTVTSDTEETVAFTILLLLARLRRGEASLPSWFGALVVALERHWTAPFVPEEDRSELRKLFSQNRAARLAAWEERIARANEEEVQYRISAPYLGMVGADDVVWLFEQSQRAQTDLLRRGLIWAIENLYRGASAELKVAVRSRSDIPQALIRSFDAIDEHEKAVEQNRRERDDLEARKNIAIQERNIAQLQPKIAVIESGDDLRLLIWGWGHLESLSGAHEGRIDIGKLRPLVGDELADAFSRGFKACWRKQEVPRPDPCENSTPMALLAGLTGLTLEIRDGLQLSTLQPELAELAARYGLLELNAFPTWFDDLRAAHPDRVRVVLEAALRGEWLATCAHHGVMWFAPRAPHDVGLLMRSIVLALMEDHRPGHSGTIRAAADALLVSTEDSARVGTIARRRLEETTTEDVEARAEWLRLWAHLEPSESAEWLENLHLHATAEFNVLAERVAGLLESDFDFRGRRTATSLMTPRGVEKWVRLLHIAVRPEDDITHEGAYHPQTRDFAQDFRRRCLNKLAENPSREAYAALRRLRDDPLMSAFATLIDRTAAVQLERAVEAAATPWSETDVVAVERADEKRPRSIEDLFKLVGRHLSRVAELVENDDFSYRALFTADTPEKHIQKWVASSLSLVCRGLYTVVRESELDDEKEVDVSAVADGIGRVPIEIKPLGRYSLNDLKLCITDQLYGKYMKPSQVTHGVLLVVRQTDKQWEVDGKLSSFDVLVDALRRFASAFSIQHDNVIAVETVDLLRIGPRN